MPYVKVLEAWPIVDQYDDFPGWMKCWSHVLRDLWKMMGAFSEMKSSWWSIYDSEKGAYGQRLYKYRAIEPSFSTGSMNTSYLNTHG